MPLTQLTFNEYWPVWPEDVEGNVLLDTMLKIGLPELMPILWSAESKFIAEANKKRSHEDFQCTDWVESETELPDLPGGFNWTCQPSSPRQSLGNLQGLMRKVRFDNTAGNIASPKGFKTEEVQRCMLQSSTKTVIDACVISITMLIQSNIQRIYYEYLFFRKQMIPNVLTTTMATHPPVICILAPCQPHRFTNILYSQLQSPVVVYTMEAIGHGKTRLTVRYHLVFLRTVNSIMHAIIIRGAKEGLLSNYKAFGQVLLRHVAPSDELETAPESNTEPENLYPYQSVINWTSLPLLGRTVHLWSDREISASKTVHHFLAETVIVVVYYMIMAMLFHAWNHAWKIWMEPRGLPDPLSGIEPTVCIKLMVILAIMVEICQFLTHKLRQLLLRPRFVVVRSYQSLSSFGQWQRSLTRRTYPPGRLGSVDLSREHVESVLSFESGNEQKDDDNVPLLRRVVDGFWTLLYYNGPDFPKFDHSLPIEKRTNPDGSVIEEVFENERLQPFRGWGHTWPGHFLPTDKFSHWSSFDSDGFIVTSDDLKTIEPELPDGWEWLEDEWQVDKSGVETDAVDDQGWFYSLDFPWIKFSPERNSGIRKISDFVRRRRLIRRRQKKRETENISEKVASQNGLYPSDSIPCFSFLNFL